MRRKGQLWSKMIIRCKAGLDFVPRVHEVLRCVDLLSVPPIAEGGLEGV